MKKLFSNPVNIILGGILIALLLYLIFAEKGLMKRIRVEIELNKLKKEDRDIGEGKRISKTEDSQT
ncbi:hypothetical protein JGI7_01308 [Candidatus Kryptonium thompsonii]|nr:hypothetical protein JGI7_01308 [Candidatus Kryptonium thompsoni]